MEDVLLFPSDTPHLIAMSNDLDTQPYVLRLCCTVCLCSGLLKRGRRGELL